MTGAVRVPLKWCLDSLRDGTHGTFQRVAGGIPLLSAKNISSGRLIIAEDESTISEQDYEAINRNGYLARGDVLVSIVGSIGNVALFDTGERVAFQRSVAVLRPTRGVHPRYLMYQLMSPDVQSQLSSATKLSAQGGVYLGDLGQIRIRLPDALEQLDVVHFLDDETSRIDALLAAKQRVLDLLAEKRKAIIATAVTGGLNPNVTLRDSGVPWLGEIPAHWSAMRIRHLISSLDQGWSPEAENREPTLYEWGVLKLNAVAHGVFDHTAAKTLLARMDPRPDVEVHSGDVLITRANTPSLVGDACFIAEARPKLMLCDLIYRMRVNPECVDGRFLVNFLVTAGRPHPEMTARGTSNSMVKLSQEHIKDWWAPLPPLGEQRAIVEHIARETAKLDAMRAATERTIGLLNERRAALIAAAVTGQLDVRAAA